MGNTSGKVGQQLARGLRRRGWLEAVRSVLPACFGFPGGESGREKDKKDGEYKNTPKPNATPPTFCSFSTAAPFFVASCPNFLLYLVGLVPVPRLPWGGMCTATFSGFWDRSATIQGYQTLCGTFRGSGWVVPTSMFGMGVLRG